jgi:MATE family multidrug resistance protein
MGIAGAALASVVSQWLGALWAVAALHATLGFNRHMQGRDILRLCHIGGDLLLRTGFLTGFLVLTTRAATRIGADSGAAHQAIRQVWVMSALLLDAFAISGQSLVGFFMGAGRTDEARRVARLVCQWSLGTGLAIGLAMWLGRHLAADTLVPLTAHQIFFPAWSAAILTQPVNALAFASDGIHWGSGDFRYLRNVMIGVSLVSGLIILGLDMTQPGALAWIWGITGGWVAGRAAFGILRIWPGIGQSPFAPADKLWHN